MQSRLSALVLATWLGFALLGCREQPSEVEARVAAQVDAPEQAAEPAASAPTNPTPATSSPEPEREQVEPAAEPDTGEPDPSEDESDDPYYDPDFVCPRGDGCSFAVEVQVDVCEGQEPAAGARVVIGLASGVVGEDGRLRLELPPQTGNHKGIGVLVSYEGKVVHNRIHLREPLREQGLKLALGSPPECGIRPLDVQPESPPPNAAVQGNP